MYKIISKSRLPLTVMTTNKNGMNIPVTLPKFGSIISYSITNSIKGYRDKGIITITPEVERIEPQVSSANLDTSSVVETMTIHKTEVGHYTKEYLTSLDLIDLKNIADQLNVNYGSNIGKNTLITRILANI